MPQTMIFPPLLAMIALVAAVWVRLYIDRLSELRSRQISPQDISTSRQMAERMKNTNAADNFKNLFEMPVLFYAFCLTIFVTQSVTAMFVGLSWLYVLLRVAHSVIHCTYNKVLHRFTVYAASSLLLFGLWFLFGVRILFT
ncbi:MAPEG family protein [Leptothoe sp. PORK10 BA2]|uniref:MAPEG family protein n=1 Tax=Leptothoe sp. PORK10 BA2 TaxID=3110254 RepID=UPI002B21C172|nr:MAPEG family protein [Leptothoe sp. PORK10 BA2]MEA5467148.1 MAPEG family protein [Leptothoe sp. PORK10 BA2]